MGKKKAILCTDGSAVVTENEFKGLGGFGVYMKIGDEEKFLSKGFSNTKTGRMEITGLLYALWALPDEPLEVDLYSDSEYVIKSFTENRLNKWVMAGWRNSSGDVANQDLWVKVLAALKEKQRATITFHHIKGHLIDKAKGDKALIKELLKRDEVRGNYIADKLADYRRHTEFEIDQK